MIVLTLNWRLAQLQCKITIAQHIPKRTNLFQVSHTFSLEHRTTFASFPLYLCHSCPPHEYANLGFRSPSKPRDARKLVVLGKCWRISLSPIKCTTISSSYEAPSHRPPPTSWPNMPVETLCSPETSIGHMQRLVYAGVLVHTINSTATDNHLLDPVYRSRA